MNEGYIILPRALIDDDYFEQKFTKAQALIDLYMLAAYKERTFYIRGNKVTVQRGQVAMGVRSLAERWQWSKNTVTRFLKDLEQRGKIGTQKSSVINVISLNYYGIEGTQNGTQNGTPYINILLKENIKDNKKRKSDALPDYVSPAFAPIMRDWMAYKKERGQAYKARGLKACYTKLLNLSGNDPTRARAIVEQSMSNNYSGLFKLKNDNDNNYFRRSPADNIREAQEQHIRQLAATLATAENGDRAVFGSLPDHR